LTNCVRKCCPACRPLAYAPTGRKSSRVNNSFVIIVQYLICYESKMHDGKAGIYTVVTQVGKIFVDSKSNSKLTQMYWCAFLC
jgi:hypothetical protein